MVLSLICTMSMLHISASGIPPQLYLASSLQSLCLCRTLTFDLQKRLPTDRVGGTITLTIENNTLPPNPASNDGQTQEAESMTEVTIAPTVTHVPPSSFPVSRLASLRSEESISSSDDDHTPLTSLHEEGGAMPGGSNGTVPSSNDDVIVINLVGDDRVQSSESGAGVQMEESVEPLTAESAAMGVATATQNGDVPGESDMSKSEAGATISGPKEQLLAAGGKSEEMGQSDEHAEGKTPAEGTANEEIDMIRLTLYGSRRRLPATRERRSHTVLDRHVSLRVPPHDGSHDRSRDFNSSQRLSGSISMSHLNITDIAESLPPSKSCIIFSN